MSGNVRTVERLKNEFTVKGKAVDFNDDGDVVAVAGLLKLFLRELPESLVPESLVKQFITVQNSEYVYVLFDY